VYSIIDTDQRGSLSIDSIMDFTTERKGERRDKKGGDDDDLRGR
jgi:hypothetical protein